MTVPTHVSWQKVLAASAIPVIGFAFSEAYFTGQMTESFSGVKKDVSTLSAKVDKTDAKVDTLTNRQTQNNYNNALQFQAIWNELHNRNKSGNKMPQYASEKWVNGKLVLVADR